MLVVCDGMPRSGSTWSFHVVRALLKAKFPDDEVYSGPAFDFTQALGALRPGAPHAVLKTHSLDGVARNLVCTGAAKAVYTYRNLADAVASGKRLSRENFKTVVDVFKPGLDLYRFHVETGMGLLLRFEKIVSDSENAVQQIAQYLFDKGVSRKLIRQVVEETSLARMRERVALLNEGKMTLMPAGKIQYDPQSMLFTNHIDEAQSGKGRKRLTQSQLARIDDLITKHGLPR